MADPRETDTKWFESAKNGEFDQILMLKFEDVIADKSTWIQKVADFVGLTDFNMEEVIDQISVANTIARRKAKFEAAGVPFWEIVCYRKGESKSWQQELSEKTKQMFEEKYPDLKHQNN